MESKWLSTEEAASYLGLGKTKLYSLSQSGRIPVKKVGKKWVYEKELLDQWLRASKQLTSYFASVEADIENNSNLREPQRDGYLRAYDFFRTGEH